MIKFFIRGIDWVLFPSTLMLLGAGLFAMNSFVSESYFFNRQLIWIGIALLVFFIFSLIDFRFLRRSGVLIAIFLFLSVVLGVLLVVGEAVKGSTSWFRFGSVSLQPSDFMKLILVLMLAKYFSRRHVEIANIRHIVISGLYAMVPLILILLQKDFGSTVIIFLIWFGMTIVSGISKKHLLLVITTATVAFGLLWLFAFSANQKARIVSFIQPLADVRGAGYNAFQSTIAVGSGQLWGKGVGYGTQSRLEFLPEYETDFIFAAFAEEWGFVGVMVLFTLFGLVIWRILVIAFKGDSNFESLYGLGLAIIF
ncbi:MAG: FtsW/RodA/SpoVE family cell cycle protein, partial [Patescibacteria group bacterium]